MANPGGGPFLRDVPGVFNAIEKALSIISPGLAVVGPVPFCLFSINFLCCSRMFMLRSSCSRIVGSWVLNPGDRHATPKSCRTRPALSRDVNGAEGRAVRAPGVPLDILEVARLSRLGRCRPVGGPGDVGSFLTMTFGI